MRYLFLILITCGVVACSKPEVEPEPTNIETTLKWKGATAEQIQQFIAPLIPELQMAIIMDGEAALYHRGTVDQAMVKLERLTNRPYGLMISPPKSLGEHLPTPPEIKQSKSIEWIAKTEAIEEMSISKNDLLAFIQQLKLKPVDFESIDRFKYPVSATQEEIPLNQLVDHRIVTIERPIVVKN